MTRTNRLSWSSPATRPSGVANNTSSTRGRHRFVRWAESISLIGAMAAIVSCGTPAPTETGPVGAAPATNQTSPQATVAQTAAETTRSTAPVAVSLEPSPETIIGVTTEQLLAARKAYGSAPIFSLLDLGPPPKDLSQLATRSTGFADCVVVRAEAVTGEAALASVETVMATQAAHVVCQSNATTKLLEFDITVDQTAPERATDAGFNVASSIAAVFIPGSRLLVFLSPSDPSTGSMSPAAMAGIIPVSNDGTVVPFDPRLDGVGLGGSTDVADVLSVVEASRLDPV